jgi:hypothetical protein
VARTFTTTQRNIISGAAVSHHLKVETQDADGTWQDLTNLAGVDWVISAEWGEERDTPVSSATLQLRRSVGDTGGTSSLAPLLQSSTINRNAAAAYAPLLELGRGLRISTAALAQGATPISTDYIMVWEGRIDSIDWPSDPVQVYASSLDAWLADTQIKIKHLYGASGGTAVETVMQSILTDHYVGGTVPTLYTPSSPGWNILTYTQDRVKLLEALRALALQIGFDLRYRYDAANANRLTFYDPLRNRTLDTDIDATFGPTEYLSVTRLNLDIQAIRNSGVAPYRDASGVRQTVSQTNAGSISKYRERYFELDESINIRDSVNAQKLINAAVSDMAQPVLTQDIETLYAWFVQLYDRYKFLANGDHYDSDQYLAVGGYRHRFENGYGRTTIMASGHVVGAYAGWQRLIVNRPADGVTLPYMRATPVEDGSSGTLQLVPVDPQSRLTKVMMAAKAANLAIVSGDYSVVTPVSGIYSMTVNLVDKQPVRVAYQLYALNEVNVEAVVDEDFVRFGFGAKPLPVDFNYIIAIDGTLTVTARGDGDTTSINVALTFDGPAGDASVDAAPTQSPPTLYTTVLTGRSGTWNTGVQLKVGQKFYITARAYNSNLAAGANAGPSTTQTDQWLGTSNANATASVASATAADTGLTLGAITLGPTTARVEVYAKEYTADPGALITDVSGIGHKVPLTPLYGNSPGLFIPGTASGNWLLVTLVAVDALGRVGTGLASAVAVSNCGRITLKYQLPVTPPTYPPAPASLSVAAGSPSSTMVLSITMPGSTTNLDKLRIKRDGVFIADVNRTAAASAVQTYSDLGQPAGDHVYEVFGLTNLGVPSTTSVNATGTVPSTTLIPAPVISVDPYSNTYDPNGGFDITITPGTSTPSGVTWHVEHSITSSSTGFSEILTTTSLQPSDTTHPISTLNSATHNHWIRVYGLAPGYSATPNYSNVVLCAIPRVQDWV